MSLISTNEAKCRDCYKCLRSCPVKAISIKTEKPGTAVRVRVIEESCIQDGLCTLVCPQKAKVVNNCLEDVKKAIARNTVPVIASVAPSFPVALPLPEPGLFPAILRRLGFSRVEQTAVGAGLICLEHGRMEFKGPLISSACPVIVNIVERHYPRLIPHLSPLVSPMIAHARLLKSLYPGSIVVFIGPCIAKKGEALSEEFKGDVDYVLGFTEVWEWIKSEGLEIEKLSAGEFDGYNPGPARLFPLEGGQLMTTSLSTDMLDKNVHAFSGLKKCMELLASYGEAAPSGKPEFIELLACEGGCVGGPYTVVEKSSFIKKQKLLDLHYRSLQEEAASGREAEPGPQLPSGLLYRTYRNKKCELPLPSPEQIDKILAMTDKFSPEDELNCGACGFNTCRDKAVAVFHGYAEPEMCIPYMRRRAESLSNQVLQALPDAVVIVRGDMAIEEINPAAEKMFNCTRSVIGQDLEVLTDPTEFLKVFQTKKMVKLEVSDLKNKIDTRQIIFPLGDRVVGILTDITEELKREEELSLVKTQTINRAQEVIKKQMTVAQVIAGLLGETTAETKALLNELIKLMKDKKEN
ncbi:hypothtical hydrogenase [Pelotomaculum thermopropionicum SI]|uniref:Hypothtical hydrogenase n=1 Tax=Pelotomaculum thermopropionicum (strain DSM 13744 / JCM 10971 / SI) TaxID=370438 RepID=A5D6C0_PELTS|nr:hypothtical hydrogenase [Pelotomaculum thermopropionicum SI]